MKAKLVRYERVFRLGNYESERIGIDIELEDGDKAIDALTHARKFVYSQAQGYAPPAKEANPPPITAKVLGQEVKKGDTVPFGTNKAVVANIKQLPLEQDTPAWMDEPKEVK